ncbi:MAG: RHS repeat-associated core domain-containing protein, partial [Chloroflexota bacterium]
RGRYLYNQRAIHRILLTQDPIGLAGGVNLYAYAGNNPVGFSDPFGLCPEWVDGKPCDLNAVASFAAGFGDAVSLGGTDWVRNKMGTNDVVDKDGAAYFGGQVGAVLTTAGVGSAAAGASEARAGKVVIGETMSRVRAAAGSSAETFETGARSAKAIWKANSSWLRKAMRDGKEIIDIGTDATRPIRSQFYRAEKALIESRGYPTTSP